MVKTLAVALSAVTAANAVKVVDKEVLSGEDDHCEAVKLVSDAISTAGDWKDEAINNAFGAGEQRTWSCWLAVAEELAIRERDDEDLATTQRDHTFTDYVHNYPNSLSLR